MTCRSFGTSLRTVFPSVFFARRAIVFATYTGVPDKKCVNLCLSVCLCVCLSRCNAPRMTTIAGFLQDYNSILVYFCAFHRALLGGVFSNWSCVLRTWRMWRIRIWEIAWFVQDCMIWARLVNTIALRATLPCRCNLVSQKMCGIAKYFFNNNRWKHPQSKIAHNAKSNS